MRFNIGLHALNVLYWKNTGPGYLDARGEDDLS
jgi:hypothetical protein